MNLSPQEELPPPVQNGLSENDPVYFILDTVIELDLSTITDKYKQEQRGLPLHSPRMMTDVKAKAGRQKRTSRFQPKNEEQQLQHKVHRLFSQGEAMDQRENPLYVTDWVGCESDEDKDSVKQGKADGSSNRWPNQGRNHTASLDLSADRKLRLPTWEEAARKCVEVYQEVVSEHKSCHRT